MLRRRFTAYLEGGGFMSYGPDIVDSFRLSAIYVAKILKGAIGHIAARMS